MGAGDALDQAVESQAAQVVAHFPLGHGAGRQAQQRGEELSQIFVGEPVGRKDAQATSAESSAWVTGWSKRRPGDRWPSTTTGLQTRS